MGGTRRDEVITVEWFTQGRETHHVLEHLVREVISVRHRLPAELVRHHCQMPELEDSVRLFLALWPGRVAKARAFACQSAQRWPLEVRLIAARNLHVTLHFLGSVPRHRLPDLTAGLDVSPCRVAVTLDRLELWQKGIAVLAADTVPPALSALHDRLADRLQSLGMRVDDRPYRPHMTLARKGAGVVFEPVPPIRLQTAQYALVESKGGQYTPLHWYRLATDSRRFD